VLATDLLTRCYAVDPDFRGGVFVAAGDIDHDGLADIVVGADSGTASTVRTFKNIAPAGAPFAFFQQMNNALGLIHPYAGFLGGVRVAVGDVNGDGFADIITGSGLGARPHVKVYDGRIGTLLPFDPSGNFAEF